MRTKQCVERGLATVAACLLAVGLAGCGASEDTGRAAPSQQQGVSEVLQEQMQEDDAAGEAGSAEDDGSEGDGTSSANSAFVGTTDPRYADDEVDVDLTVMSADMVYATVNDMMTKPADYLGKIIRMKGPYYHTHYEETDADYFYVIIEDATACCSQGIEFVWDDGSHAWPGEYPEDGAAAVVTGVFDTYAEGENVYAHLRDADFVAG